MRSATPLVTTHRHVAAARISLRLIHYMLSEWCDVAEVVECKMGGFPNPRNCSKCVCPGGYGGDRCDERVGKLSVDCKNIEYQLSISIKPEGSCGSTIKATSNWTNFTIALGDPTDPELKEDFTNCTYWIELSREATRKCVDYPTCPPYADTVKTCYDQSYITFCPKLCNLCNAPQSTNTAAGVRHSHKK
ncbi:hypothetical protein OSTOST_22604 [Ostertagia ostertagi]